MTGAERQARHRAARMSGVPVNRIRRRVDRRSRIRRWNDTIATLTDLQMEHGAWLDALPDNQRDSATAEALRTIVDLDLPEFQAIEPPRGFADDVVNMRLPKTSRPDRILKAMACAMVVLAGALGVVTFQLTTCGGDQPKLQGTVGGSLADGIMIRPLRSAQAMQAQADTSFHEDHNAPATALVATVVIPELPSHAAHEFRAMRKSAVGARKMVTGLVTYSDRGTWLFPPDANGGG
jgi:hypothetical protein